MSSIEQTGSNPFDSLGLTQQNTQKKPDELGQDEFLTLMLAQMKNQDPLKPMENGDFIAQLAQFQTVTGVDDLNATFSDFAASMQSNQALQASALVGREVLVPGSAGFLPQSGELSGSMELPAATSSARVNVYDTGGQLLGQVELGPQPAGQAGFSWDGRLSDGTQLPPGAYQLQAEAVIDGKVEAVETLISARVDSVSLGQGGREPVLNLANVGPMGFSQVREIR
jgi:flagellar basal-body rod modification protein FlgD